MHVGAPYNGTIQITPTGLTTPGQIYSSVFISDYAPSSPQYMDTIITWSGSESNGDLIFDPNPSNGYLVPIPGIKWNLTACNTTQDSSAITFASSNDAVGACLSWGYDPIANGTVHQACTRMKRADFCGTGGAWTTAEGGMASNQIALWDNGSSVHANPGMPINLTEALWTPSGAACVNPNALRSAYFPLIQYDQNGNAISSPFDPTSSCGQNHAALPPCTSFSTSWNIASSGECEYWDSTGTQCLSLQQALQ